MERNRAGRRGGAPGAEGAGAGTPLNAGEESADQDGVARPGFRGHARELGSPAEPALLDRRAPRQAGRTTNEVCGTDSGGELFRGLPGGREVAQGRRRRKGPVGKEEFPREGLGGGPVTGPGTAGYLGERGQLPAAR